MNARTKTKLVLLGAGKIGVAIAEFLSISGDYKLNIADRDAGALDALGHLDVDRQACDVEDGAAVATLLDGADMVVSALPYFCNRRVAEAAVAKRVHYFDLTEDVATTRALRELAASATTAVMPQCGLAPGFVSVVARDLFGRFDEADTIQIRVGALPQFPSNELSYNLTWSTDGLINDYCNSCEAIYDHRLVEARPLDGQETFALDGVTYEAFNTSGGLGTLCASLDGKIRNLDYKTVRYPGHRDHIRMLTRDLRLCERRDLFKDVLERGLPMTVQDVALIFVTATGRRGGDLHQESFVRKIYSAPIEGTLGGAAWGAIQITTAAGLCAMVDLVREGKLPIKGFVAQEDARLDDFLANRFGAYYADETVANQVTRYSTT